MRTNSVGAHALMSISAALWLACSGDPSGNGGPGGNADGGSLDGAPNPAVDSDQDSIPNPSEDRDQDGVVDPGETDPAKIDTDGDGIPDAQEVATAACSQVNDRRFEVYDLPGADSMVLVDARVSVHGMLRTPNGRAPGGVLFDPEREVAAVLIGKRPQQGVASPAAQRDYEQRTVIEPIATIQNQTTRSFTTVEGFRAEQASFRLRAASAYDAASLVNRIAVGLLEGVQPTGLLPEASTKSNDLVLNVLTIYRSPTLVVVLVAAAVGTTPSDAQLIRIDELTDGTNVARHGSFTRHVCDEFKAEGQAAADILWVVDDSGSMEDDQQTVRAAADAMASILGSAQVDYRLAVARMFADDVNSTRRGVLEGSGFTRNLQTFRDDIVVGANGGWEPGLEVGILALDKMLPKTTSNEPESPRRLREDAAVIVIHLSDERDQSVECQACGSCGDREGEQYFCTEPAGQTVINDYIAKYKARGAVTFAIVGDLPTGCQQTSTRSDFEPGQGYVEVANATGGQFGSLCGDMRQNLEGVARGTTGVASAFQLSVTPASATLKVAIGPPGQPRVIARSRENGFDYDAVSNKIIFYGTARPEEGWEVVVGYRRWDWADNPATPPSGCDDCEEYTSCAPELDTVLCQPICGDQICGPGLVCLPDEAICGDPSDIDDPPVGGCNPACTGGLVCNPSTEQCVVPCETTGCEGGRICNTTTHVCEVPNF